MVGNETANNFHIKMNRPDIVSVTIGIWTANKYKFNYIRIYI